MLSLVLFTSVLVSRSCAADNLPSLQSSPFHIYGPFTDNETPWLMSICNYDVSREAKCFLSETDPTLLTMYNVSRAALRITKNGRPHCTGWLVGNEGHILTNQHCVENQAEANLVQFEAMAEGEDCDVDCRSSLACAGEVVHTEPVKFLMSGDTVQKDYTLLQLPEASREPAVRQYGFLRLRRSGPVVNERVYIPQHPAGWGKRIAAMDGDDPATIMDVDHVTSCGRDQVTYRADTQGGSSGSPVISAVDHAVVAIHHCGGCSIYANTATNLMLYLDEFEEFLPASAIV